MIVTPKKQDSIVQNQPSSPIWRPVETPPFQDVPPPEKPKRPITVEPEFDQEVPVRQVDSSIGPVLADIDSHMPAGHIYKDNDKITWGHETSHGVASRLRMNGSKFFGANNQIHWNGFFVPLKCGHQVFKSNAGTNSFYLLNNRAITLDEPNTTIQAVAKLVPRSLRGGVYSLYMVQQAQSWGDTPLYIFDEWIAYSNGSAVRSDMKIQKRGETVQFMLEFNVYALCMAKSIKDDDAKLKTFLKWHLHRTMNLWEGNKESGGDLSGAESYWEKVKTSSDAEEFRSFARDYLGQDWAKQVLGF